MAERFGAPLYYDETTRLLADLNRSVGTPDLHSEATRHLGKAERRRLLETYYFPHRRRVDAALAEAVAEATAAGDRVVHVASHSFTPELHGKVRTADIGMLYDPRRPGEVAFATAWIEALRAAGRCPQAAPQLSLPRRQRRRLPGDAAPLSARGLCRPRARGEPALCRGGRTGLAAASGEHCSRRWARRWTCRAR